MRALILDPLPGISGDMFLAALGGLGFDYKDILQALHKMGYKKVKLELQEVEVNEIKTYRLKIKGGKAPLSLDEMIGRVKALDIPQEVKGIALSIIKHLSEAERAVHGEHSKHRGEIHTLDTLIDALGVGFALQNLGVGKCLITRINVPRFSNYKSKYSSFAPATLELLKGFNLNYMEIAEEIITPTAASIIKSVCEGNEVPFPEFRPLDTVYSTGSRKSLNGIANLFRLILAELRYPVGEDEVYEIITTVDDLNPEILPYLQEKLFQSGALDVWFLPYYGKKNRIGIKIESICPHSSFGKVVEILFNETTTHGIRYRKVKRKKLQIEIKKLKIGNETIRIKIAKVGDKTLKMKPEYEDCRKLAIKHGLPIQDVYKKVLDKLNDFTLKNNLWIV